MSHHYDLETDVAVAVGVLISAAVLGVALGAGVLAILALRRRR